MYLPFGRLQPSQTLDANTEALQTLSAVSEGRVACTHILGVTLSNSNYRVGTLNRRFVSRSHLTFAYQVRTRLSEATDHRQPSHTFLCRQKQCRSKLPQYYCSSSYKGFCPQPSLPLRVESLPRGSKGWSDGVLEDQSCSTYHSSSATADRPT